MDAAVIELHIFCDASPLGFGAVGFRVERHENGNVFINIVTARSCAAKSIQSVAP